MYLIVFLFMCENKNKANQQNSLLIFQNEIDLKKKVERLGPTTRNGVHLDYFTRYSI